MLSLDAPAVGQGEAISHSLGLQSRRMGAASQLLDPDWNGPPMTGGILLL